MADPLGLIGSHNTPQINPVSRANAPGGPGKADPNAPEFKDLLMENLRKVNQLQTEATQAAEDLSTGKQDVESVMIATEKADTAFRMLLAVRNKVMGAYEEIKQIRV